MTQRVEVRFEGTAGSLVSAAQQAQHAMEGMQKGAEGLKHVLEGIGVGMGLKELFGFGVESAKAFATEESAARTLQATLLATGRGGRGAFEEIRGAAEKVAEETGHLDEELIGATGKLAEYAKKLSVGDLAKAQTAIVGLSELTGKSFEESASMIGRSLAGTRNLLTRYIGEMGKGLTESQKLAVMNERLAASYEVAKDKVNSAEGAMRVMHNGFIRLQEAIGGVILRAFGFQGGMKDIGKALDALAKYLRDNAGEFAAWGALVVAAFRDVAAESVATAKIIGAAGGLFGKHPLQAWSDLKAAIKEEVDANKAWGAAWDKFQNSPHKPLDLLAFGDMKVATLPALPDSTTSKVAKDNAMKYTKYFKYWLDFYWQTGNTKGAQGLADSLTGKLNGGALPSQGGGFAQIDQLTEDITSDAATLRFKTKLFDVGTQAGESLIRGIIQGTVNLRDILSSALEQLAEYFIMPALQGALGGALGLPGAASAGGGTVPSLSMVGAGGGGAAVNAYHTTNISINAVDAPSFQRLLDTNHVAVGAATVKAAYNNPGIRAGLSGGR